MVAKLTAKIATELASHEGLVREAYKDSVGVWTWSIGITSASGHKVYPRYKDNPQDLKRCLEVYVWLVENKYLPTVLATFAGFDLKEHELAAALSFHYNTGRIHTASWPDLWKSGQVAAARAAIMNWSKPAAIIPRRTKERDLFFDGTWSNDGKATEYKVKKPPYTPDWPTAKRVDIAQVLADLIV